MARRTDRVAWGLVAVLVATGTALLAAGVNPVWVGTVVAIGERHFLIGSLLAGLTAGGPVGLFYTAYQLWKSPPEARPFLRVPPDERKTYYRTAMEAIVMARSGQVAKGYTHMLTALHRVETLRENDEPWVDGLTRQYEKALNHYVTRHGTG